MKVAQVPKALVPPLTPLVLDAKVMSAIVEVHSARPKSKDVQLRIQSTSAAMPVTTATAANYQDLMVIAKDFLAPTLSQMWPKSKIVINGVLALSATVEAWKVLRSDDADNSGKAIAVTRAGARVVSTLLAGLSVEAQPNLGEVVADAAIATAATLHDRRLAGKTAMANFPPPSATKLTPLPGNLLGGYLIGTNLGLFAFQGKDLLALSAKPGDLPRAKPKEQGPP